MSEVRKAKLDAIDEVLRNNPDMRPEFRAKLENLRATFEASELRRQERIESSFANQAEMRQEWDETMVQTRRRIEKSNEFYKEWKDHHRRQTDLIRRIAAKL